MYNFQVFFLATVGLAVVRCSQCMSTTKMEGMVMEGAEPISRYSITR